MNMVESSDVCSTEDAIEVFLQHLVDPLLPEKSSVKDNPTPPQQETMAKQVRSAVLLYNYYHRKQHPELEYLPFNEFCKLIVVLRPPLLAYMQFMQTFNEVELIDVEKQLSLTEKMIMDACDVCKCLDASKNAPNVEGWPISKVSILLIDGKKENCFLLFGSITEGVWSVVEKSVDASSQSSEVTPEMKNAYKRKRVIKKSKKDELKVDEDGLLQIGYSAVKEATGINNTDIMLLESYTVYSQSKEKAASRFFIMQCSQSVNQDIIKVPLKDVIESLQGPLVKKGSSSWTITPAVAYFHVLPYSEIISQCISRKEPLEQRENNGSCAPSPCDFVKKTHEMDVNGSSIYPSQNREKRQNITKTIQVGENQEKNNASEHCDSNGSASAIQAMKVDSKNMIINEGETSDIVSCGKLCANSPNTSYEKETTDACTQRLNNSNSDIEKLQSLQDSKKTLSRIAISSQIGKRNDLAMKDEKETTDACTQNSNNSNSDTEKLQSLQDSKKTLSQTAISSLKQKRNDLVDSTNMIVNGGETNNIVSRGKLCANSPNTSYEKETTDACTQRLNNSNSDTEKLQSLKDSKKTLSRIAISSQIGKRNYPAMKVVSTNMIVDGGETNNIVSRGKLYVNSPNTSYEKETTDACPQNSNNSNSDTEKLQSLKDSKKTLSRIAISSQIGKRNELAMKVDSTNMIVDGGESNNIVSCGKLCVNSPNTSYEKETTDACPQNSNHSNSNTAKLQSLQDSKKTLSRTAISSLIRKRNELALQQHKIDDEIASCDEKIQRMLTDGKDDYESMIECIMEGCNDVSVTNQEGMGGQQSFPRKKRDFSELQSSCQDRDGAMS
ncbi:uncharacterized protein LOC131602052 [Vicia villosa]|uniref:uncharacterized protein LOC131602052 n=1 Tax=Vicia villosa TaxID=3911 RepID=UPI00273A8223|nr:uncharacterized protein LOC131602052 [Vicia villosa]XP_058730018.1 uncharacterized protein LOC131602052 [Vicia villosa]XP_058730019.1 uncharacterized protein LOC131602052 [Vicia villosa]